MNVNWQFSANVQDAPYEAAFNKRSPTLTKA